MTTTPAPQAILEPRLLCGPGPANASPGVMEALARPPLGHLDPDIFPVLLETAEMLAATYLRDEGDGMSIPLSSTGTSGMETGMASLLEPGDTAVVGVNGYFGRRLAEIARRYGANVIEIEADWGEAVSNEEILAALEASPDARLVAVVHAETSTGVRHDLAELGEEMKGRETFLLADCVTSLGGCELRLSDWGVDFAYSCSQKCLGMSSGMSPISISQRALDHAKAKAPDFSFYLDLALLEDYWITRPPTYHHTLASPMLFGMHEALREVLDEGLEARWARHAEAGGHLQDQIRERGMTLVADPDHQLAQLTAVHVPEGVDGKEVQLRMLREHGIEIGGGLPGAPAMWRIGLMGTNATIETADRVLEALDAVLEDAPVLAE